MRKQLHPRSVNPSDRKKAWPRTIRKKAVFVSIAVTALAALFFSIAIETVICIATPDSELYDAESIYPEAEYYTKGYQVTNNYFTPLDDDPQIGFRLLGQALKRIIIEFDKPLGQDTAIEVYYAVNDMPLAQERSISVAASKGDTVVDVELAGGKYTHIRLDMNGSFALSRVIVGKQESIFHKIKSNLDIKQLAVILVITEMLAFFLLGKGKVCLQHMKRLFSEDSTLSETEKTQKDVWRALVLTLVAMLFFWLCSPPHFTETNDDLIMASFAYGYMGEYEIHLAYINILIGCLLRLGLLLVPRAPWYALLQCVIIYFSASVLCFLILRRFEGKKAIPPLSIAAIFFGYQFFSSLQFTKTAAIAVIAGLSLAFYAVEKKRKWYTYLLAAILTLVGSLYRFKIFAMMLIFFFSVGVAFAWQYFKSKDWKMLEQLSLTFAVLIAVCFGCYQFDKWMNQQDEGWAAFLNINPTRDQLDNQVGARPAYSEYQDLYASLNITSNDYNLYVSRNYADPEVFTLDAIKTLVSVREPNEINFSFINSFIEEIGIGVASYYVFIGVCSAFGICLLGFRKENWEKLLLVAYLLLAFIVMQFYFYYIGQYLQSRIDISIFLCIFVILMLYGCADASFLYGKPTTVVFCVGVLLFLSLPGQLENIRTDRQVRQSETASEVHQLIASDQEHFYFYSYDWTNFSDKMYDIWYVGEVGCGNNCSALGNWRFTTPIVKEKLTRRELTNPYRDMINNNEIYFLATSETHQKRVLKHIQEHYAPNAKAYLVKTLDRNLKLYRIATEENPPIGLENAITISDEDENIHYKVGYQKLENGHIQIFGYIYEEGTNSFASNIYISLVTKINEYFHYTTQSAAGFSDDIMNGAYSTFVIEFGELPSGTSVGLYLETGNAIYRVETGISF